jgi:predicted double-glycine peptidase
MARDTDMSAPQLFRRRKVTASNGRRAWRLVVLMICLGIATPSLASERVRSLREMRQEGVVIQEWDASCAAAALATVLTYTFDDPVSERAVAQGMLRHTEPLRVRYRGGFSLLDMKRYVEERGYQATGFRGLSFDDLILFEGAIVPLNIHGYNHYVVFKGLENDGDIWLGDPAFGNRRMPRSRFEDVWMEGMAFVVAREPAHE